ncbi:MAG: cation diffusion facilitator family transporter [Pirellulales bacterium]
MAAGTLGQPLLPELGFTRKVFGMSHHHHHHHHGPADHNAAFAWGVALNAAYIGIEVGCGLWANSLALLADAGHNASDVLGLLLAWGAHRLSSVRPTERRTYGWRSSSILAALVNAIVLLVAIGGIAWEAVRRFGDPGATDAVVVIVAATLGTIINTATALLFIRGKERDLNIRGAFLHMAADAAISLGVVVAGVCIWLTGWTWIDPAVSLAVAGLILWGTWGLFRDSANLALHAVPAGIDPREVRGYLAGLPGVEGLHDLHIWAMSTTEAALTAHLVMPNAAGDDAFLAETCRELHDRFGIEHTTLQIERGHAEIFCRQSPDDVV